MSKSFVSASVYVTMDVAMEELIHGAFSEELRTSDLDLGGLPVKEVTPSSSRVSPLLEPTAWPPAYVEGFVRPYFVAESIASGVLKVQAALAAAARGGNGGGSGGGGGPGGGGGSSSTCNVSVGGSLVGGVAVASAAGAAHDSPSSSASASASATTPTTVGANGGLLCGAVSMARHLESVGIEAGSRVRLTVRVSLLQCDTSEQNPLRVAPSARINPLMARRKNLFRTSAATPEASHGGTATWPATPGASPELFVVDINGSAPRSLVAADGTPSPLRVNAWLADWQYLKGYLLFQLFSVEETPASTCGVHSARPSASAPAPASSTSARAGPPPTLIAQSVLRLCDLFAGASLPFVAAYSGLHQVLFPGGGGGHPGRPTRPPLRRNFFSVCGSLSTPLGRGLCPLLCRARRPAHPRRSSQRSRSCCPVASSSLSRLSFRRRRMLDSVCLVMAGAGVRVSQRLVARARRPS